MAIPSRILSVEETGKVLGPVQMIANEVQTIQLSFTDYLAERFTGSTPTIPDPTATGAWSPASGNPTVGTITRTATSINIPVTAPAGAYTGTYSIRCTLNSALATEEIRTVKVGFVVTTS